MHFSFKEHQCGKISTNNERMEGKFTVMEEMLKKLLEMKTAPATSEARRTNGDHGKREEEKIFTTKVLILKEEEGNLMKEARGASRASPLLSGGFVRLLRLLPHRQGFARLRLELLRSYQLTCTKLVRYQKRMTHHCSYPHHERSEATAAADQQQREQDEERNCPTGDSSCRGAIGAESSADDSDSKEDDDALMWKLRRPIIQVDRLPDTEKERQPCGKPSKLAKGKLGQIETLKKTIRTIFGTLTISQAGEKPAFLSAQMELAERLNNRARDPWSNFGFLQ
ncbi:hypothetical protein M5K25_020204 [Dendrobium thyrsiflorum]|uniref:Uncharacterized protein n=1 Tax=Dendrobium thyrsiflorum TaxID=117978 RepID=A0ABD0U9A6_DENTH